MSAVRAAKKVVKDRDGPTWKQMELLGESQADIDCYVV